jgi:putative transposase
MTDLCRALDVSTSAYYAWERGESRKREQSDAELLEAIKAVFEEGRGQYGAPRVHDALRTQGWRVSPKRVARLMRENDLRARAKRKFKQTTDSEHALPIAKNLLERDFHTAAPNRAWVSDITYIRIHGGWLYLAAIIDLYSRRVVGWALRNHMSAGLLCDAFDMAVRLRRPKRGLIFHSDRGSQYASKAFRARLRRIGARQSMSRKGDCWDNAVAESFFATLKKELIYDFGVVDATTISHAVFDYIEVFYNRTRIHTTLGAGCSPAQFEDCHQLRAAA